jgi:lysozyme
MANPRNKWLVGVVAAVTLAGGMLWEGKSNVPYFPIPGDVATVCYGETNVKMQRYTDAQCLTMLKTSLTKYGDGVLQCVDVPINQNQHAAYTLFAYNVGTSAFCKSTLARQLNAGNYIGSCLGLLAWSYAGGRYVQGLHNRRQYELNLCMKPPLPAPTLTERGAA